MELENLKDLKALLQLCRKQGVTEIKLGTVEFKLGDLPREESGSAEEAATDTLAGFPAGELSPTQLMFYSAGGLPDEDPENKQ